MWYLTFFCTEEYLVSWWYILVRQACLIFHILVFCCNHRRFGKAVGVDFIVGREKQPPLSLSEHAKGPHFFLLGSLKDKLPVDGFSLTLLQVNC